MTVHTVSDAGTRFAGGRSPKQAFVFGAGVSIPATLPSAQALLKRAMSWKISADKKINTNLVEAFCDYFYPGFDRTRGQFPDAEDMLGMMDAAKEYSGVRGGGRGYKWRTGYILDARRQLVRLIGEYLWSFQNEQMIERIGYLRNIVRQNNADTIFISFNYDLLLETALTLEGIEFSYAIDKKHHSRNVILKPHGSINWFYPSEYSRTKAWQERECTLFLKRVYIYDQLYPDFLSSQINPPYVLIAPTPHKQIENEFLKRQWTSFSSAIHCSSKVTIVGYSLPAADRLARIVLRRGGPGHNVSKQITVIDPGQLAEHYRKVVSPRVKYIEDFCENYFG